MEKNISMLQERALNIRRKIIRCVTAAASGHTGGPLDLADIFAVLFFSEMKHDPKNPASPDRDFFHLSCGHTCPVWYAALCEAGYLTEEELMTLRKFGSRLQGHPHRHPELGISVGSGSLGQGLSIASGVALGYKLDQRPNRVYCQISDGEQQEGQIWEAALTASHRKLDNLCAILDNNNCQIDGYVDKIKSIYPLGDKWRAFGWNVLEIDGHSIPQILEAFETARKTYGKPTVIIAKTVMGKGVSFMENDYRWHGKTPTKEQAEMALKELGL